jgi:hypothetical protein
MMRARSPMTLIPADRHYRLFVLILLLLTIRLVAKS